MSAPDPAEYLLARYAEDEEVARAAGPGPWSISVIAPDGTINFGCIATAGTGVNAHHIARHAPARVLAGIAAKRAVLALTEEANSVHESGRWHELPLPTDDEQFVGDFIRLALLQEFADRPDFPDEWRTT